MDSAATVVQLMNQIERRSAVSVAGEGAGVKLTIAELRSMSNRLANAFIGLGLRHGDRVAYASQNHLEYLVLEFALLKAGLVKVPLNPRMTGPDLLGCISLAEVRLIVADLQTAAVLDDVWSEDERPLTVVIGERAGWQSFATLTASGADAPIRVRVGPDDIYHIRFSSGSTGKPKGIAISHRAARSAILGNLWVMCTNAPTPAPRTLQAAPLVYAGGWSVLPTLLSGGTNVFVSKFDADNTIEAINDEGIDWMFAVPTMLRRFSGAKNLPMLQKSRLGCLMLAGEPAALPALESVSRYTDALVQCWGQTEAPASTTMVPRWEMNDPSLWPSIGRPIPGVEFSLLIDGEVIEDLRPGVEGELVIRSETVATQLLGAEAEHRARKLDDGWWRTSDLGRFDDEGRAYIVGRASEVIITGGTNIQPVEIERALEEHDQVVEAVVVGVPDEQWGETPAALIYAPAVAGDSATVLMQWLQTRLAGFKRPRHLFVSAQPLPRASAESKIARGEMKRSITSWVSEPAAVPVHVTKVTE